MSADGLSLIVPRARETQFKGRISSSGCSEYEWMNDSKHKRLHIPCDAFDLKENVLGESCHLDGGTGRLVVAKEIGVDVVNLAKVVHVLQKHL